MKPARFDYCRPDTMEEALRLIAERGRDTAILAGGQSLVPMLNLRLAKPSLLVDIKRISALDQLRIERDRLIIGALTRHADVLRSEIVRSHAPLIADALQHVAHPAVRNRGTFGGSLALADPAAELPACAVCLGAEIVATSTKGERHIPADEFFTGLYATSLDEGEIISRVEIPLPVHPWVYLFDEVARRHGDFAVAGLALAVRTERRSIRECRIVLCGVESSPRRMRKAEACLIGADDFTSAAHAARRTLVDDLAALGTGEYPSAYRLHIAGILLERAMTRLERWADT
jgi:aerobic carbon-monoxide dehydrogenase medium subunit